MARALASRSEDTERLRLPEVSPEAAAVVVTHNTREVLARCLARVAAPGAEVVVVDTGSTDGSRELVAEQHPELHYIYLAENAGFGAAANEGVRHTRRPYVLLLNADAWPCADAIRRLVAVAEFDPAIAVVAPAHVDALGTPQRSVFGYPGGPAALALWAASPGIVSRSFAVLQRVRGGLATLPRGRRAAPRVDGPGHEEVRRGEFPSGAALLLRREAFLRLGGFDERFFMYSEETDLCHRLRDRGWKVVYAPGATVVHVGAASTSLEADRMYLEQLRSYIRFIAKHSGRGRAERARRLLAAALRVRALATPRGERAHARDAARWLSSHDLATVIEEPDERRETKQRPSSR